MLNFVCPMSSFVNFIFQLTTKNVSLSRKARTALLSRHFAANNLNYYNYICKLSKLLKVFAQASASIIFSINECHMFVSNRFNDIITLSFMQEATAKIKQCFDFAF